LHIKLDTNPAMYIRLRPLSETDGKGTSTACEGTNFTSLNYRSSLLFLLHFNVGPVKLKCAATISLYAKRQQYLLLLHYKCCWRKSTTL